MWSFFTWVWDTFLLKKIYKKIGNYRGSYKKENGAIKVQWCRTCWWTRAAVPVTGGPFFSGLPPGRGSYVPGGNRNGCHRGGNRTCLQAWLTISGEHGAALTPPPRVTSVSSGREGAEPKSCGWAGQGVRPQRAFYGVSTSQTARLDELVSGKNDSRCRVVANDASWSARYVKRGLRYWKHVEMARKEEDGVQLRTWKVRCLISGLIYGFYIGGHLIDVKYYALNR